MLLPAASATHSMCRGVVSSSLILIGVCHGSLLGNWVKDECDWWIAALHTQFLHAVYISQLPLKLDEFIRLLHRNVTIAHTYITMTMLKRYIVQP